MKIKLLLLFLTLCLPFLVSAQYLETFEGTTTNGATSFNSNGQTFNITTLTGGSTLQVQHSYSGSGWSGTQADDKFLDNDGTANTLSASFSIANTIPFRINSFWIFLGDVLANVNVNGTLTIKGRYNGIDQFTAISGTNFNNKSITTNNGYTLIDLTTFGGVNNSVKNIDEIIISTTGDFNYIGIDALTFSDPLAPVFTLAPVNPAAICPGANSSFTVAATNTYGYQWQVDNGSGFANITNGGVYSGATTATLNITGATAGLNGYQYRAIATGVPAFLPVNSAAATLTINPTPSITTQPVNTSVTNGGTTTITAATTNSTGFQWQVDTGSGFTNVSNTGPYSGATTNTLTITNATLAMNGYSYRLVATGSCSPPATSSAVTLTVNNSVIASTGSVGNLSTVFGTSSTAVQFNVSGTDLTEGILVAPPAGFEVSTDNVTFQSTVTVGAAGNVASTPVYVRLTSSASATSYSGNIVLTSNGAATINVSTTTSGTNTVTPAPITITANNANKTYGQTLSNTPGSTAFALSSGTLKNGNTLSTVTINYTAGAGATDAATVYTGVIMPSAVVGANGFVASNYNITYAGGNLTINPALLSIAASNAPKTYGQTLNAATGYTAFTPTGLLNGETIGSTSVNYGTGAAATAPVGTYTGSVVLTSATGGTFTASNYTITYTPANIIVGTAGLTITALPRTKTYGDAVTFAGTEFTSTGLANGDAVSGVTLTSTGAASTAMVAGSTYPIVPSAATGTGLGNYAITYASGALTVSPRALTVVNTDRSKVYGDVLAGTDFAGSITGIQNGDNITLTRNSTGAVATAAVGGTYPIVATLSDPDNKLGNYTLSNPNGTLTVTQKGLTITALPRTKTYGDAVTFAGTEFTSAGLANGDAVSGVTLTSTGAASTATVAGSTYPIVPSAATGTGLGNYAINYASGALTVSPRALTVVNTDRSKVYGDVLGNTDFAGSITGIQNGDNITLTRNSTGAVAAAAVGGTYPIVATLADPDNKLGNYALSNPNGTLTVTQKGLTITALPRTKTYGDAVTFAGTEFTSAGLANGDAVSGVTLTSTGAASTATVAGSTYPIVPSAATGTGLGNYAVTYASGALTVSPRALTVVNTDRSKVYGDVLGNTDFAGSITGIQNGDNITLTRNSTGAVATAAVGGTYPIVATLSDPDNKLGNYALSNPNGTLTVTQKGLTITALPRTKTYGDAIIFAGTEFTSTGLANGDAVSGVTLTSTGAVATATVAGSTYPIVPSAATGTGLGNYAINYASGALTVSPRALTVVNTDRSKVYGDVLGNTDFAGSITGIQNGDNITLTRNSTGAVANAAVGGTYPIVATLADPDNKLGNYALSNPNGTLTVTQKGLTITALPRTKTYGDAVTFAGTEFTSAGLANGDAVSGVTLTSTGAAATATVAGSTYPIVPSAATGTGLGNYAINYVNNVLTVNRKVLTITADNKEKFLGTPNPPLTVSYTGFVNGETASILTTPVGITTTALTNSPLGDYPITASGATAANYTIVYVNGILKVKPGAPTSVSLAAVTLLENRPIGTTAGTLSSTSDDPAATFTYSLVSGTGDTDNALFAISGTSINTAAILDYETKSVYSILVRSTTQYGFSLDKIVTINLTDVNEVPTLATIANQTICYTRTSQNVSLTGISTGPETSQTVNLTVSSSNAALFDALSITGNGATRNLVYQVKSGAVGTATVTVTVKDNGGTANGGVDTYSRTFVVTVNALPVLNISSDKGMEISKGAVVSLNATGATTYNWAADASILSGNGTATLQVRPSKTTTYTVTGTNASGCVETKSITITVLEDYVLISGTNILTPNSDGKNDFLIIRNIDMYPNNEIKIYDIAGRVVYSKKAYDNTWGGTFNGSPLAKGTYYYIIDFGDGKLKKKGFVSIVRD